MKRTAGQDRFRTVNAAFYRGADGIILVYDVSQRDSFERVEGWCKEARASAKDDARVLLIGNKADLANRQVTESMGRELAQRLGSVPFLETSAKTATNVESAFLTIAAELVKLELSNQRAPVPIRDGGGLANGVELVRETNKATGTTTSGNTNDGGCACN